MGCSQQPEFPEFYDHTIASSSTGIDLRLVAVRRLAYEASDSGLLGPDLAAAIWCLDLVSSLSDGSRGGSVHVLARFPLWVICASMGCEC